MAALPVALVTVGARAVAGLVLCRVASLRMSTSTDAMITINTTTPRRSGCAVAGRGTAAAADGAGVGVVAALAAALLLAPALGAAELGTGVAAPASVSFVYCSVLST